MAIKTRFALKLEVDDKEYKLNAGKLGDKQIEEIDAMGDRKRELTKARDNLAEELQYIVNEYAANQVVMQGSSLKEKVKLALKQKELNTSARDLRKKIQEKETELAGLGDVYASQVEKRFDLMVEDGEGKRDLVKLVRESNLTYTMLVTEINSLIASAREKKSETSSPT